jgi:hypothetical protein
VDACLRRGASVCAQPLGGLAFGVQFIQPAALLRGMPRLSLGQYARLLALQVHDLDTQGIGFGARLHQRFTRRDRLLLLGLQPRRCRVGGVLRGGQLFPQRLHTQFKVGLPCLQAFLRLGQIFFRGGQAILIPAQAVRN